MGWFRIIAVAAALSLVVPMAAPQVPLIGFTDAGAQERQQGGLFRALKRIFGDGNQRTRVRRQPARQPRRSSGPRIIRTTPAQTFAPAPKQKAQDAKVALVLGDNTATELSAGLIAAFGQTAALRIADRSRPAIGLAATARPGMRRVASATIDGATEFDFIVVLVGQHDRVAITDADGTTFDFRQDDWAELYSARVEQLALTLLGTGKPVFWMGLPPERDEVVAADLAYLNDIYDAALARVGARFIDVWDGFVSAEGQFLQEGPDHAGQIRALRTDDGKGFTPAGQRKLAFYVEARLKRLLKDSEQLESDVGLENNPLLLSNFDNPNDRPEIWEVALTGGTPRRNIILAGATPPEAEETNSDASQDDETSVISDDVPAMRADNFVWRGQR